MSEKQLTIQEKWDKDIRSHKSGVKVKSGSPQCVSCVFYINGNTLNCRNYVVEMKPKEVLSATKECRRFLCEEPLRLNIADRGESRLYGGLFGFCVGDMLGVPVEFSSRGERDLDPVRELRAHGTYYQPFGTWSDDTSLTLCLVEAFCSENPFERLAQNMVGFLEQGMFTPKGEVFDVGIGTSEAIRRIQAGIIPTAAGGRSESNNGNGSLMRILPLAYIADRCDANALINMVFDVSAFTHGHIRSQLACVLYTVFASGILHGYGKRGALEKMFSFAKSYLIDPYTKEMNNFRRVLSGELFTASRYSIRSTGYVVDTLEAALWSFLTTNSYRDAVLRAVNLGGDTDTIAAITGGLAGMFYGYEGIPSSWIQNIIGKEEIAGLIARFGETIKR